MNEHVSRDPQVAIQGLLKKREVATRQLADAQYMLEVIDHEIAQLRAQTP